MDMYLFQTRMGRTFYEHTLPELVRQVGRLADNVAALDERLEVLGSERARLERPQEGEAPRP